MTSFATITMGIPIEPRDGLLPDLEVRAEVNTDKPMGGCLWDRGQEGRAEVDTDMPFTGGCWN